MASASIAKVAIYEKSTRALMREMVAEMPIGTGQVISKDTVLNWFSTHYPKIKEATVSAHLIRLSTNARSRVHYSAKPGEDDVFWQVDGSHFRLYDPTKDPAPIGREIASEGGESVLPEPPATADDGPDPAAFAYESDLRNFLSKNLAVLEPGLRLYEEEGITGIEFPAGGRFIDILAMDARLRDYRIEGLPRL